MNATEIEQGGNRDEWWIKWKESWKNWKEIWRKTGKPFVMHVRNDETGEIEEIEIDDVIIEISDEPVNPEKPNEDSDDKSEESSGNWLEKPENRVIV